MATIYFTTDQSGANTEVCSTQSSVFNFSASAAHTAAYASLVVKKGSGTTAGITVAIYSQANGGGSVVASVTLAAASILQTYTATQFNFPANTTLNANQTYSLKVSSTTGCGGSNAYFFKAGGFQIYNNETLALLSVGYGIAANGAAAPQTTAAAALTYGVAVNMLSESTASALAQVGLVTTAACLAAPETLAAASAIKANETNTLYHGASLIGRLYCGSNRIQKMYLGTNTVLDQPT